MTAALNLARAVLDDTRGWGEDAACVGKANILENPNETPAKTMCAHCPVIAECTSWVFGLTRRQDPGGVRAGMNENQRNRARRRRRAATPKPVTVIARECTGCGHTKPADEFNRNRSRKDGLAAECRDCTNARQTARRAS